MAVALRDETKSVSVAGNGLTFVQIADLNNAQAQTGVNLFRAMGAAPTSGSITVTIGSGNTLPVVVSATRFAGADTSGLNGSGAIEAVATNAGPPVTDDRNMKINVTTLAANAFAYAAGTHRLATFTVPPGETAISINNVAGADGDKTTLSTWFEVVATPGTVTLGADNDLNSVRDWAVIAVSIRPAGSPGQALSQTQTVTGSITTGTSITLPAWTPAANDLILVAVALRDETRPVSVAGNGLTFVEIANLDNAQGQTGVNLFRAMGAAPASGAITVTIGGNTLPAIASATRFAGADTSGTNGSGAIEAVATNAGPPVTDDDDMKIAITTLTANAWAYAAGTHRLATFALPSGEIAISINNFAGAAGDMTTLSTWYEAVPAPGTVTLGADNDLSSVRDWAVIAVSIKPAAGAANAAPTVSLTSPANGATFTAPASIVLTAAAQDTDGTVAQVEFFQGATLVATDTTAPFTFALTNVAAGSYTFTARATDNVGASTTSAAVSVTVNAANAAPTVSLTSPANNAVFTAPASITLTANAQDSDGTVAQVEFFQGGTLVATDTTAPFTFTLTNVAAGSYTFTARATDNLGASTTSAAVSVTVNAAAQLFFIHTDHLNTPRVITNQVGQAVWQWNNDDPFGGNVPNENPSGLGAFQFDLRFPGQVANRETNTNYNYLRDAYDPATGRYIQSDPIGIWGGLGTYSYGGLNPITYSDQTGELAWVAAGAAIGAVINVSVTYAWNAYNGQPTTANQLIAAATSGAIAGAAGALGGPIGGTLARWLGTRANGAIGIVASGLFSGAGGYAGQVAANYIDPCNPADPWNAAIWSGVGGGVAGALIPMPGLYTISQANYFQPQTFAAINRSPAVRAYGASAGIGGASVFGWPIAAAPAGCACR